MHKGWGWHGKEVVDGGGQDAMGQLTCTKPGLTTACHLNPAVCVGSA